MFLGPEYVLAQDATAPRDRIFGLYELLTPFSLIAGRVVQQYTSSDVVVVRPADPSEGVSENLARDIAECARAIRQHLGRLFGEPAVHHGAIVAVSVPGFPSSCLGSAIILNTDDLSSAPDPKARRARLIATLAHEYAHAWWNYSTVWENPQSHALVSEMLAVVLECDCVTALEGRQTAEADRKLWNHAAHALRQPEGALLRNASSTSGAYAASLLVHLSVRKRDRVIGALQQLWSEGRKGALSRHRLEQVLATHLSDSAAVAVRDALDHPRPLIVSGRVAPSQAGGWKILLRPYRAVGARLQHRLIVAGYWPPGQIPEARHIAIDLPRRSEVLVHLQALEPAHIMLLRSVRLLMIHSRPWLARLWAWASATHHDRAPGQRSSLGRLVRSSLALILNEEDPSGWQGLAAFFEPWWSSLARRCAEAAGRRATYAGEENLLKVLEGPTEASEALSTGLRTSGRK